MRTTEIADFNGYECDECGEDIVLGERYVRYHAAIYCVPCAEEKGIEIAKE